MRMCPGQSKFKLSLHENVAQLSFNMSECVTM